MKEIVVTVLVASFGALIQELISWYNIRNTLSTEEHQKLMHDAGYWVITALMVVAAGIGTWAWFNGEKHPVREYLLTGAAFPLLLKKGAAAVAGAEQTKLGPEKRSLLRRYFQIN